MSPIVGVLSPQLMPPIRIVQSFEPVSVKTIEQHVFEPGCGSGFDGGRFIRCPKCNGKGFRGRMAIFELMVMNSEIRSLAFERASISKVREAAIRGGMRSLLGDGKIKILRGITTPEEIARFAQIEGFNPNEIE